MIKAIKQGPEITEPEEDGKGYPPLPPSGPQGGSEVKTEENTEAAAPSAVADATVEPAKAEPAVEAEAAAQEKVEPVPADNAPAQATEAEAEAKADSAKGGALNAV